ncbi:hypothetical protein BDZ89DRAFT_1125718 [Hymenopellis radicata]|nr:hypothetical protein BDZ89DRAFT_1125718 [Hymenopellis radicata]
MDSSFSVAFRKSVLNIALIQALLHGVYTVLYLYIACTLVSGVRIRQQATVLLAMTALYLVATTHLVADWVYVERGFVYHGQTENTMMDYLLINPPDWMFLSTASFMVNTLFADCFLVWRCWLVWDKRLKAAAVPGLFTIIGTVFAGLSFYQQTVTSPSANSVWSVDTINWSIPYFSLSLATTLVSTILIVWRLVQSRSSRSGTSTNMTKLIEMVVESCMLYSLCMILLLAFFVQNIPAANYLVAITASVTGIAPTLIVVRLIASQRDFGSNELEFGGVHDGNKLSMSAKNSLEKVSPEDLEKGDYTTNY